MIKNYPSLNMEYLINSYLKSFYVFIFLLVSAFSFGQTVTLGSGTNVSDATFGNVGPVSQYYNYMHFQVVYTAAELIAAGAPSGGGPITSFGWNVSSAPNN